MRFYITVINLRAGNSSFFYKNDRHLVYNCCMCFWENMYPGARGYGGNGMIECGGFLKYPMMRRDTFRRLQQLSGISLMLNAVTDEWFACIAFVLLWHCNVCRNTISGHKGIKLIYGFNKEIGYEAI